jgi:hypothetical protein
MVMEHGYSQEKSKEAGTAKVTKGYALEPKEEGLRQIKKSCLRGKEEKESPGRRKEAKK